MRAEMTGILEVIGETKEIGKNGFTKREFVVTESDTKYPNPVKFSFKKDNCALLDNFKKGDEVKVTFSIDGRSWTKPGTDKTQWFVDLTAFKIAMASENQSAANVPPPAEPEGDMGDITPDEMPF